MTLTGQIYALSVYFSGFDQLWKKYTISAVFIARTFVGLDFRLGHRLIKSDPDTD